MKITTIRLPDEEYEALQDEARARDTPLSEYLQELLVHRDRSTRSSDTGPEQRVDRRREQRKAAARAVLEYLRDQGEATQDAIREHVEPTAPIDGVSPATWWERAARPALDRGRDAGLVEFVDGHDVYWWVGEEPIDETDAVDSAATIQTPITDALAGSSVDVDTILGGTEETLQERREALEAALHSIAVSGPTTREELCDRIYPYYSAGYDTATEWCDRSIAPALNALQHSSDLLAREGEQWHLSESADPTTLIRTAENTYRHS